MLDVARKWTVGLWYYWETRRTTIYSKRCYISIISSGASARGPRGPCPRRTDCAPRWIEYTEYHENVLRSYIGVNSSTHSCKSTERCQERKSASTECSKTFSVRGSLASPVLPLQNCAPQCPPLDAGWRRPWISYRLRLKLVFSCI